MVILNNNTQTKTESNIHHNQNKNKTRNPANIDAINPNSSLTVSSISNSSQNSRLETSETEIKKTSSKQQLSSLPSHLEVVVVDPLRTSTGSTTSSVVSSASSNLSGNSVRENHYQTAAIVVDEEEEEEDLDQRPKLTVKKRSDSFTARARSILKDAGLHNHISKYVSILLLSVFCLVF